MADFWCEQAWVDGRLRTRVRVSTGADGMISAVAADVDHRGTDIVLRGIVFGGFANVHSHAFHRALRGRTHADSQHGGSFWTWRSAMYAVAASLTPDTYFELARAAYAEMVLAGICAVGEFHYLHHDQHGRCYADPNAMSGALRAAAAEAGIRLTLLDTCYLHGGLTADGYVPLTAAQRRFGDGSADAWRERHALLQGDADTVIGAAIHSNRAVSPDEIPAVVAGAGDGPLHVHLSEQPAENDASLASHGRSPTEVLRDGGALGPQTTAVHATHLTATDVALLGGGGVCLCPTTERDLSDGIGPGRALADAGASLSVGSDSHAIVDLLEEVRAVETHERLASQVRGHFRPAEQVDILTRQGYAALGRPGGGALRVGSTADLVAVRTDSVRTTGAAPEQLIMVATAADVTDVVVGGVHQVRGGEHRLGSVSDLLRRSLGRVWADTEEKI